MKIVACIFAILSGIFGLFGGTVQSYFGSAINILTNNDEMMKNGFIVFLLSWVIIILGGLSIKFPKQCGVGLLAVSIASFLLGNIFSAPFAFIAGIFDLFAESTKKNNGTGEAKYKTNNTNSETDKTKVTTHSILDKTSLLNEESQLLSPKEINIIAEEIKNQPIIKNSRTNKLFFLLLFGKLKENKKIVLYTVVAAVTIALSIFIFKELNPVDYTNPKAVIKKYKELLDDNNPAKIYDDLLSNETKKTLDKDEFIKIETRFKKDEMKILNNVFIELPLDNNNATFRRFIIKEKSVLKNKTHIHLAYWTLTNKNGKWKIIWDGKLRLFGNDQYVKGDFSGAIRTFNKIIEIDPYNAYAYSSIAACYDRDGQLPKEERNKESLKNNTIALNLDPESPGVYNSMAGYFKQTGNPEMSIVYLQRAIDKCLNESDKSIIYDNISILYLDLKDFDLALDYAQKGIYADSTVAFSWFRYGKIKCIMNEIAEAQIYYKKAIALNDKAISLNEDDVMEQHEESELYGLYAETFLNYNQCDSAKKYLAKALDLSPDWKFLQILNNQLNSCK